MVSLAAGLEFKRLDGTIGTIGSQSIPTGPPVPKPTAAPTPPTRSPTGAPSRAPTPQPTRDCTLLKQRRKCTRIDYCAWQGRSCLNKDATAPPSPVPVIETPEECLQGDFATAESTCSGLGMRLCEATELHRFSPDGLCNQFNRLKAWSSSTCKTATKMRAYIKSRSKSVCVDKTQTGPIRCCRDP
jgi:hypothetical protein